jgi:hypothetical protein
VVESTLGDELSLIKRTITAILDSDEYVAPGQPSQGDVMKFLGIAGRNQSQAEKKRDAKSRKGSKGMSWGNISVSVGGSC